MDTEIYDPALSGMRGCTVHGHSLRLDEAGLMFDMLSRQDMGKDGSVYQVKDQVGIPFDRRISLGKPMSEAEAKKGPPSLGWTVFPSERSAPGSHDQAVEATHHMWIQIPVGIQARGKVGGVRGVR